MRVSVIIYLFFLLPCVADAQSATAKKLDSLHQALKTAENDSVRMELLDGLYFYYSESNRDSAMYYTDLALIKSREVKQPLWTAYQLINKAYLLQQQRNLSLSFKLLNESRVIAEDEKSEQNLFLPPSLKTIWYNPHEARLYILGGVWHNFGNTYNLAGNTEKAIQSYKEVARITEGSQYGNSMLHACMSIGSIYLGLNQLDSARSYNEKALWYAKNSSTKKYQGVVFRNLGYVYLREDLPDSAKYFFWRAVSVSKEQNNTASEIEANIALAKLYNGLLQTDSLYYYASSGFKMAAMLKAGSQLATTAELLSHAFRRLGNTDSAFAYLSIAKSLTDSLSKARTEKLMEFQNVGFEEQMQLEQEAQESIAFKNRIRTGLLLGGLGVFSLIAILLYRNNLQKQKAYKLLQLQKEETDLQREKVEATLSELKSTQKQLIQAEKMASLGELTAGIAHEIQNPLNFVNNFSEVSTELIDEMKTELQKGDVQEGLAIADDLQQNLEKINHHGKRADAIVKGMLEHSRAGSGERVPTDINALADEYLRLAYHGLRAKDKNFNADLQTNFDPSIGLVNIIPQDIGRVVLNLINNALYAVNERSKRGEAGYKPMVKVSTEKRVQGLGIRVEDNGDGISDSIKEKIFQPFFTTKPTGQGTGLGLSLAYDIVKAHGGDLIVGSVQGEGTVFTIQLLNH